MKNKDIHTIQKIIEYCDIVDILLDEYDLNRNTRQMWKLIPQLFFTFFDEIY